MEERERISALEVALNNEMREHEFYLKQAERTTNPAGKVMFGEIAKEELEHYERLKELHKKWTAAGKWPDTVPLMVNETNVKNALAGVLAGAESLPIGDRSDIEAVRTAIDFEQKGEAFYAQLRDSVRDKAEKAFFDLLSKIEHEHYLALVDAEEYLEDPASWFRRREHQTFDGG